MFCSIILFIILTTPFVIPATLLVILQYPILHPDYSTYHLERSEDVLMRNLPELFDYISINNSKYALLYSKNIPKSI